MRKCSSVKILLYVNAKKIQQCENACEFEKCLWIWKMFMDLKNVWEFENCLWIWNCLWIENCLWIWKLFVNLKIVCEFENCLWIWKLFMNLKIVCEFEKCLWSEMLLHVKVKIQQSGKIVLNERSNGVKYSKSNLLTPKIYSKGNQNLVMQYAQPLSYFYDVRNHMCGVLFP